MNETNWAGNYTYRAAALHSPETIADVQALIRVGDKVKALGTRHCFNDIADVDGGDLISLERLKSMQLDADRRNVKIGGGVRYGELGEFLNAHGWALHNLASLPHISVVGACATATHGSGVTNGNLATAVSGMEIVTASGDIVTLDRERDGNRFRGVVVGLGGVGVVTKLTLDVEPGFEMRQDVYVDMPWSEVEANFDAVMSSAYSVSLFTDWRNERFKQVWRKSRMDAGATDFTGDFYEAKPADKPMNPVPDSDPVNATEQFGVPGPWHDRLPHFRYGFKPSAGDELQSEYFVAREDAVEAMRSIWPLGELLRDQLLVSEVRTIAADDLWMSPCYGRDSVAFHFTWKRNWPEVSKLLPQIEAALAPFDARPHWGKTFTMSPDRLRRLFPRMPDFRELLTDLDPNGKFRNAYLDRYVFGTLG